jgi:hypothetical protein
MTDELIAKLAAEVKPVRSRAMERLLLGAVLVSGLVAALAMLMWLGMRPDMATATETMMFWTKFSYTLGLAGLGGAATLVLARPGGRTSWPWLGAIGLLAVVLVGAFGQMAWAGPGRMMPLVIGDTFLIGPLRIMILALPILLAAMLALRRMAPTRPALAGFAAGFMAGGTGAWIYSFACPENGIMFLALWYTLGVLLVAGLGAMLGRFLLRW